MRPRLHVSDRGSGEPVLLITGWTISSAVFDPIAPLYLPHVRVIAYDHRGTGRSAPWPAPVSIPMLAADAAHVIEEAGLEHAHVAGISMGALVALELALRFPHRVRSLVLIGGGAGGPGTALPHPATALKALGSVARESVRHGRVWPEAMLFSEQFRAQHPERVAELTKPFGSHPAPPWAIGWQTTAVSCFGRSHALGDVRACTLVLHGDQDVMSPPANARKLARGIPGARLELVEGAGHAVPLERATESAELLLDWVAEHAHSEPAPTTMWQRTTERLSRPLALHTGTLRNTADALALPRRLSR